MEETGESRGRWPKSLWVLRVKCLADGTSKNRKFPSRRWTLRRRMKKRDDDRIDLHVDIQ